MKIHTPFVVYNSGRKSNAINNSLHVFHFVLDEAEHIISAVMQPPSGKYFKRTFQNHEQEVCCFTHFEYTLIDLCWLHPADTSFYETKVCLVHFQLLSDRIGGVIGCKPYEKKSHISLCYALKLHMWIQLNSKCAPSQNVHNNKQIDG